MNQRSMTGPRRCDTRWQQTRVLGHFRPRVIRSSPMTWHQWADVAILALFLLSIPLIWWVQ